VWISPMNDARERNRVGFFTSTSAFVFLCLVLGLGASTRAASDTPEHRRTSSPKITSQIAIADFDGDNVPDLATVQVGSSETTDTQYWIHFQQSTGRHQTVSITAPAGGLRIASRDINGDSFPDLILTTAANQPVAVLLNDGRGHFENSDPAVFPGAFANSESSWSVETVELRDTSAALLSRNFSRDYDRVGRGFSLPDATTRLITHISIFTTVSVVACSLGRAPPFFPLFL
jgi:hypothetical protein